MKNKVYIIGAGPGDVGLLTCKARELLNSYAEVVVHDRLISKEILDIIPAKVEKIFAGKEPDNHIMKQEEINNVLVEKAKSGKKVVRLKGGDPFIFGRGGEEAETLKAAAIDFEVVPGISAAIGAAAENLLPLTYRNLAEGVMFITGHIQGEGENGVPQLEYELLAKTKATIALYMAVKNIGVIAEKLIAAGKPKTTPCLVVSNATTGEVKKLYAKLGDIADKMTENGIKNPAIIYIGDVVKISQNLVTA